MLAVTCKSCWQSATTNTRPSESTGTGAHCITRHCMPEQNGIRGGVLGDDASPPCTSPAYLHHKHGNATHQQDHLQEQQSRVGNVAWEWWRTVSGWCLSHPSKKYESQLEWIFPIYGKIRNVPNHQAGILLDSLIEQDLDPGETAFAELA